jgi:hypothetical protein
MSITTDPNKRMRVLMDVLAERTSSLTDQEVLDDAVAEGVDVEAEAARARSSLLSAIQRAKKRRLEKAGAAYKVAVASVNAAAFRLPQEPSARRELLSQLARRRPEMREAVVTLQHRNFDSLSDDDVESALRQLQYLGVLNEDDPDAKK